MNAKRIRLLFLALLFPWLDCWALLQFEDAAFPELITSSRALAMGNAYISKVDDPWAAFYNPAGLGTVRGLHFHVMNMHLETNAGFLDTGFGGNVADNAGNAAKMFDAQELRNILAEKRGVMTHSRLNLWPNMTFRYFSMGFMYSQRNRAIIKEEAGSDFEMAERQDIGPVGALNLSLFGGVLKFGATAIALQRKELIQDYGPTEQVIIEDADYKKGRMLLFTGGFRLTLPWALLPTFSAVLRNTSGSTWTGEEDRTPTEIKKTVDYGFSITPQIGKTSRVHFEVNYKDFTNEYEVDAKRRVGFGMEFDFVRRAFFRIGYGDGFGSYGVGLRTRTTVVDITSYAVDTTDEFMGKEDRRYVFSIARGF